MTPDRRARTLAWALGAGGVAACVAGGAIDVGIGAPRTFLLVYGIGIMLSVIGALIAARQPHNSVGWLMLGYGSLAGLFQVFSGYGYAALGVHHNAWPLGSAAAWIGAWIWIPTVGFLALIAVRFPDGRTQRFGGVVDGLYIAGTALFVVAVGLLPPKLELSFSATPSPRLDKMVGYFQDPIAFHPSVQLLIAAEFVAIIVIVLANAFAVGSLIQRYLRVPGDQRLQIKWFAYAGALCAAALVYGAVAWIVFGQQLYLAFTPLEVAALTPPAAIGIAILRYRLYDIDLIINRTLVYGGMTAILAALYAAVVALLNRFFTSVSGQKSDAAFFVTAFVVVAAAYPLKDWLQRQVDRRVRHASPSSMLDQFRSSVDAVVSVMDVNRMAHRLLDEAIDAFDAQGAAIYLQSHDGSNPLYSRGYIDGEVEVEVALQYAGTRYGRLALARRRGEADYTASDRAALQRSADSVGEALALAAHLGFEPLSRPQ